MKVLLTGVTGLVGSAVLNRLAGDNDVCVLVRDECVSLPDECEKIVADLSDAASLKGCVPRNTDVVIHAAARAHITDAAAENSLAEFRRVNVEGTLALARQAASANVQRLVFISSIKVNGEETPRDHPFTERDLCAPQDPYGLSKFEAELGLKKIADATGMEVVIVRPPLVYGPGVNGNFARLIGLMQRGLPLPLGAINNKRSFVGVENLADFIVACSVHPAAANQTFLVADGEDLSTTDLLKRLAAAMGKPSRLFPFPASIMLLGAHLAGKHAMAKRLLGSLRVDIDKASVLLDWVPPVSVNEGLKRCVAVLSQDKPGCGSGIIRLFDILLSAAGLLFGFPILLLLMVIGLFDTGAPIFRQERVGKSRKPFILVKFRTMDLETASVASHLASASSVTKFGHFLRRTKLDELPQLWNVLKGEMSLVGPRPCLYSQEELIRERELRGVYNVRPGITGLAQLSGIDMSTPKLLAETDARMISELTIGQYVSYIAQTIVGKGSGDRVRK